MTSTVRDKPEISIIIVNWNTKDLLLRCLKPLQGHGFEIIVVDNASTDGSAEACAKLFPDVLVVRNEKNLGFSNANNIGVRHAAGDCLFFLNSDTIPTAEAVRRLRWALEEIPADIVGARCVFPNGRVDLASARPVPRPSYEFFRSIDIFGRFGSRYSGIANYDESQKVECVSGAAMMMTRRALDMVGGWPEDRFMYGDDTEICMNALKQGLTVYYVADAVILHIGGGSTRRNLLSRLWNIWVAFWNLSGFIRKHYGLSASLAHLLQFPLTLAVIAIRKILRTSGPGRATAKKEKSSDDGMGKLEGQ